MKEVHFLSNPGIPGSYLWFQMSLTQSKWTKLNTTLTLLRVAPSAVSKGWGGGGEGAYLPLLGF